ncbi:TrbM/KikA/MpfK family conjugal transfer protein [Enterobacter quasiroggenkampii]|uniref:TrbM/KikA/MpfK family conjugal transfer protein n=1 Tax=Enterobacter quasiroggenkampii TaxID=2497436 RepID=UPI0021CFA6B5|nr:TrbM/KikA/MpfK family conjugal transfer protein [Enterobacter quasiroggenkampii]MCU6278886.1 conjugal transfer protein [Enterobacter quasiroggenkampii]
MKKLLFTALMAVGLSASAEELSSGQAIACEALLCLSSSVGGDLSECAPSLEKYYSINEKKFSDTIKERKSFLKLCPASSEEGMPDLVDAITQGAGRCDASQLNRNLVQTRMVEKSCRTYSHNERICDYETQYRISNKLPSYCQVYISNEFTDIGLHYSGSPAWQTKQEFNPNPSGKWIN